MSAIWVYGEIRGGRPAPVALELISKAAELGTATTVLLGGDAASAAAVAGEYGAAHAVIVSSERPVMTKLTSGSDASTLLTPTSTSSIAVVGSMPHGMGISARAFLTIGLSFTSGEAMSVAARTPTAICASGWSKVARPAVVSNEVVAAGAPLFLHAPATSNRPTKATLNNRLIRPPGVPQPLQTPV